MLFEKMKLRMVISDIIEVGRELLDNHEESHGSCSICLEDGRGTHAEQLQTLFDKADRLLNLTFDANEEAQDAKQEVME